MKKENSLYQEISSLISGCKIAKDIKEQQNNKIRPVIQENTTKEIRDNDFNAILDFFKEKALPFAELLKKHTADINKTLTFNLNQIYEEVNTKSEEISSLGNTIVKDLNKSSAEKIKGFFRHLIWPWIKDSYFVSTGLLKPRGFPGDYLIVESMYEGNSKSMGMGYVYDTIFLETQLCQGLRNRKDQMKQILQNYFSLNKSSKIDILNVGCGGSRELREISFPANKDISISLMDFDEEAISFSATKIKENNPGIDITPLNIDVRDLLKKESKSSASYDLIYSIGLFDYLSDKVLSNLVKKLFQMLKKDGLLIFAHKDHTLYDPHISDWFCDWKYFPRTQNDFEKMLAEIGIPNNKISFSREKDGYIYFVHINK